MYRKILVGFDGSAGAVAALHAAALLARSSVGTVTALWVHAPLPRLAGGAGEVKAEREAAAAFLARLQRRVHQLASSSGAAITLDQRTGNPSRMLVRAAEKGRFDLIVMGHSGHSRLWGRLLGHNTDRVSENAHCDVLIVRQHPGTTAESAAVNATPAAPSPL